MAYPRRMDGTNDQGSTKQSGKWRYVEKKMERRVHLSAYIARRVAGTVEEGPKKNDHVLDQGKNPTSPGVFVRSGLSPQGTTK